MLHETDVLCVLTLRSKLLEQINKKNKSAGVKPFQIKNQLMVFVNALIENPAFDSQVRSRLLAPSRTFDANLWVHMHIPNAHIASGAALLL